MQRIKTSDLFLACYLINEGCQISDTEVIPDRYKGKSMCFIIEGEESAELEKKYRLGRAVTNVSRFKINMSVLKDMMFDTIRKA